MNTKKELRMLNKQMQANLEMQAKMNTGLSGYLDSVRELGNLRQTITDKLKEEKIIQGEIEAITDEIAKLGGKKDKKLERRLELVKAQKVEVQQTISGLERQTKEMSAQLKNANKTVIALKTINSTVKKGGQIYGKVMSKLSSNFDLDQKLRDTGKSLNMTGEGFQRMSGTLRSVSQVTGSWGVSTSDLLSAQRSYSEEIGRSISLTQENGMAIAQMAQGTNLGIDGTMQMITEMDKLGNSIGATKDLIEESVKISHEMGVNSDAAISSLNKNLKLSQRYNFKNGSKGLAKMANEAARLKIDMDAMSGLADKVFRPEGAIEMAAKLQVMGGEFAKLGDAQTLMFKARNDYAGFTKDIAKASAEFVTFNKNTNKFEVANGLARDRMREIGQATGISVEKLQEMAVAQKRITEFGSRISPKFSKEDTELIATMAEMDNGKLTVTLNGKAFNVDELQQANIDNYKNEQKTLSKRAEISKSFDKQISGFVDSFKEGVLPLVTELGNNFGPKLTEFSKTLVDSGFFKHIGDLAKTVGEFTSNVFLPVVKGLSDTVSYISKTFGPAGIMVAGIAALATSKIFTLMSWYHRGKQLAKGFNSNLGGIGGAGGGGNPLSGQGGYSSRDVKGRHKRMKNARRARNRSRGLKGGGALMLAGYGLDLVGNNLSDENQKKYGGAISVGSAALSGAGNGAMMGSMFGPWGTAIGGLVGGAYGAYNAYAENNGKKTIEQQVFGVNDGVIKFNPRDKFMQVGKDTMIAGTNVDGNKKLAETLGADTGGNKNNSVGSGVISHSFEDINININLTGSSGLIGSELSKDRAFIKTITTKINEEIRMSIGGGKLNPNPL